MRKHDFCICEYKGADQLRGVTAKLVSAFVFATQYNPSTSLIQNFKLLAIFCGCTALFVSDLMENPEDRFLRDAAHIVPSKR